MKVVFRRLVSLMLLGTLCFFSLSCGEKDPLADEEKSRTGLYIVLLEFRFKDGDSYILLDERKTTKLTYNGDKWEFFSLVKYKKSGNPIPREDEFNEVWGKKWTIRKDDKVVYDIQEKGYYKLTASFNDSVLSNGQLLRSDKYIQITHYYDISVI